MKYKWSCCAHVFYLNYWELQQVAVGLWRGSTDLLVWSNCFSTFPISSYISLFLYFLYLKWTCHLSCVIWFVLVTAFTTLFQKNPWYDSSYFSNIDFPGIFQKSKMIVAAHLLWKFFASIATFFTVYLLWWHVA